MGFSTDWLDLREPADHLARDAALLAQAAKYVAPGQAVLDLGGGTGSTARAFNGTAPGPAVWRFLDADAALLAIAAERHPGSEQVLFDLGDIDALPLDKVGLVTASALLDLMPEPWIDALARRLAGAGVPLYAALNYNGDMAWDPELPLDASITASFNAHQQGDKGIGPAAGPQAASIAARVFEAHGFTVQTADSPWAFGPDFGPDRVELHGALLHGIADAAAEIGQVEAQDWLAARQAVLQTSRVRIGHTDVLATPPATPLAQAQRMRHTNGAKRE